MSKVILTVGIPASGKTTWAENFCKENKHVGNINRDDIRELLFPYPYCYSKDNEKLVTDYQMSLAAKCVNLGWDIIVSDTNLNSEIRIKWKRWAIENCYDYEERPFPISVTTAIRRNRKRAKPVPEHVIYDMFGRWMKYLGYENYVPNTDLPMAVVFDIDGTLAHMNNKRGPFEWHNVDVDDIDEVVLESLDLYKKAGYRIVVASGRDGVCRKLTEQWLKKNNIQYDDLFMRGEKDSRPDFEIKYEILKDLIAPKYNVRLVFDDRDQVVKMWRSVGIKCYQVAEGNF